MSDDDQDIAKLLGGLRAEPSAEARGRAFAALEAQFDEQPRARGPAALRWAIAAALVLVAAGTAWWTLSPPAAVVARIELIEGPITAHAPGWFASDSHPASQTGLVAGTSIEVPEGSAMLLSLSPALDVRLGPGSQALLVSEDEIALDSGRIFVDARAGASPRFRVVTPHGVVRHLGTQYLVRTDAHAIELAVREGSAQIEVPGSRAIAVAGEWVLAEDGTTHKGQLAPADARFDWVAKVPTPFALDGATLPQFLAWFQHETGLTPVYSDGIDAGKFATVHLKGSIEHLAPFEALSSVLASVDLAWHREGAKVIIEQRPANSG